MDTPVAQLLHVVHVGFAAGAIPNKKRPPHRALALDWPPGARTRSLKIEPDVLYMCICMFILFNGLLFLSVLRPCSICGAAVKQHPGKVAACIISCDPAVPYCGPFR